MSKAISARNLGPMVAILLLAALIMLVVLVFVVREAETTNDRIERPAINADRAKGSSLDQDPYSTATPRLLPATITMARANSHIEDQHER